MLARLLGFVSSRSMVFASGLGSTSARGKFLVPPHQIQKHLVHSGSWLSVFATSSWHFHPVAASNARCAFTAELSLGRTPSTQQALQQILPASIQNIHRRSVRCTATKAAKAKVRFCCSLCGYDGYQFFGKCPSCGEFGTYDSCPHSLCSYPALIGGLVTYWPGTIIGLPRLSNELASLQGLIP